MTFYMINQLLPELKRAFAYRSNSSTRKLSSSGSVFPNLAKTVLGLNGVVVAAAFDDKYSVHHVFIDQEEDLSQAIGSKYLQSDGRGAFARIKKLLINGRVVLFIGMTCQVEGLLAYLGNRFEKLYTVDLICMGIPSPGVWRSYLSTFFNIPYIESINFKDKTYGWHKFSMKIKSRGSDPFIQPGFDNPFFETMFKGYNLRPSCFKCRFKNENKIADLTLADCWGCENYVPELDDNKGLSMIIVHNQHGMDLFEKIQDKGVWKEFDYKNVLTYNSNYQTCHGPAEDRVEFYRLLGKHPEKAFKKYGSNPAKSISNRVKGRLSSVKNRILAQ